MKHLLAILLTAFAVSANAQNFTEILAGGTNNVLNVTTNTYLKIIDATDQLNTAIFVSAQAPSATVANLTMVFDASIDGSKWHTNWQTLDLALFGTTNKQVATNFQLNGINYLRLNTMANTSAVPFTNIVFQYSAKRPKHN